MGITYQANPDQANGNQATPAGDDGFGFVAPRTPVAEWDPIYVDNLYDGQRLQEFVNRQPQGAGTPPIPKLEGSVEKS